MNGDVEVERVKLEWRKWVVTQHISAELLQNVELRVLQNHMFDTLVLALQKQLLVDQFADGSYTAELAVPATWWQHWKEAHGRKWLGPWWMDRYPVQNTVRTAVVEVERLHAYPEPRIQFPEFGRPVIIETPKGPTWNR